MTNSKAALVRCSMILVCLLAWTAAYAQVTPLGDSYINTSAPTKNYGGQNQLNVSGATEITYIQFNLASIPVTASITQATLKLYVDSVPAAGSFNVDYVNGAWSESTIDGSNAPPVGANIASNVNVTAADKNQYILVNVTAAVQAWLSGSETNNGIALVANGSFNATFDSKESSSTSHPPELDIAYPGGTIAGVTTASGSGLTGGGTSGILNLSLTTSCSSGQVLSWNGSAWACTASGGGGTITGVTAGTDLTGGGTSGNVTLNVNTTALNSSYAQLAAPNTFTATNTFTSSLTSTTASSTALVGSTSAPGYRGVFGIASATSGGSIGVYGTTQDSSGAGVAGYNGATTGYPAGVYGQTNLTSSGIGVFGQNGTESVIGMDITGQTGGVGLWGDGGTSLATAIVGTVDDGEAAYFTNNSSSGYPTVAIASYTNSDPLVALGHTGSCTVTSTGDLTCTGTKNAVVPIDGGKRMVALSAIESPKNWFEDAGSEQLVNGSAVVALDPGYMQTVNTEMEYNVFLTPYGDCKGLYVTNRTANSFEVHELGGGTASLSFGYRIMALRRKYEDVRFADHTHDLDAINKMKERAAMKGAQPRSLGPTNKHMPVPTGAALPEPAAAAASK